MAASVCILLALSLVMPRTRCQPAPAAGKFLFPHFHGTTTSRRGARDLASARRKRAGIHDQGRQARAQPTRTRCVWRWRTTSTSTYCAIPRTSAVGDRGRRAVLNPTVQFNQRHQPSGDAGHRAPCRADDSCSISAICTASNVHKPFEPGLDLDFTFSTTRVRTNSSFRQPESIASPQSGASASPSICCRDFGKLSPGAISDRRAQQLRRVGRELSLPA